MVDDEHGSGRLGKAAVAAPDERRRNSRLRKNYCPVEKFQSTARFHPFTGTWESAPFAGRGTALSLLRQFLLSVRNVVECRSAAALEGKVGFVGCIAPRCSRAPLGHHAKPLPPGATGWALFWYPMIRRSEGTRTLLISTAPAIAPASGSAVGRIGLIIPLSPVGQCYRSIQHQPANGGAITQELDISVAPFSHAPPLDRPKIQVVPLRGLWVVGAAAIFVVVSIAGNWEWALVFNHVVGGALWTSIDLFAGLVIGPILGRLSIPARAEFAARFMPKMVIIMPTVVMMTLASGFQIARKLGNLDVTSPNHSWLIFSFCVVGVMAVTALGILEPANIAVLFEMNKPVPNGERIARLMKRFLYTAGVLGLMQIATLIIMTRVATQ